jgi:hypothetical protein
MIDLLFLLPILASIALVLGATRSETIGRILAESTRSFLKMLGAIVLLCIALQAVLYVVPLFY